MEQIKHSVKLNSLVVDVNGHRLTIMAISRTVVPAAMALAHSCVGDYEILTKKRRYESVCETLHKCVDTKWRGHTFTHSSERDDAVTHIVRGL